MFVLRLFCTGQRLEESRCFDCKQQGNLIPCDHPGCTKVYHSNCNGCRGTLESTYPVLVYLRLHCGVSFPWMLEESRDVKLHAHVNTCAKYSLWTQIGRALATAVPTAHASRQPISASHVPRVTAPSISLQMLWIWPPSLKRASVARGTFSVALAWPCSRFFFSPFTDNLFLLTDGVSPVLWLVSLGAAWGGGFILRVEILHAGMTCLFFFLLLSLSSFLRKR